MRGVVAIDGKVSSPEEAFVPVLDRGFLYGDSVYEVIRTYDGEPFALREHLERLFRSAELVELELDITLEELQREVHYVLGIAGEGDWYLRLVITRGGGPIGLDPALADVPRRVLIVLPVPEIPDELRNAGVAVVMIPTTRDNPGASPAGAKTGNYLTNIMALRRARREGAFEALMIDPEGRVSEGTTSNVFVWTRGALYTPPLAVGILDGITRSKVLSLCRDNDITIREDSLRPLDLLSAEEMFLTGTVKEVLPITRLNGHPVGDGLPGPVTQKVGQLYRALTKGAHGSAPSKKKAK